MNSFEINLQDLAALEHYENLKEAHLCWVKDPEEEAPLILKRCTNLRRLTLAKWMKHLFPSSKELCDFIMELKHLTFLHIIYRYNSRCDHFKSVRDKVNSLVLPRRLNFEFYLSCCSEFSEFRVPTEFLYY